MSARPLTPTQVAIAKPVIRILSRADYWPKLVAVNPDYGNYQARTQRKIPVIVLSPR